MSKYYPEGTDLRYVDITHEQEKQLFTDARDGDSEAREFLIRNHLLFALNQGRSWARGRLNEDDIASAANYAVMLAFDKFDHTRGVRFSSYLRQWIRSSIADLWKDQNTVRVPAKAKLEEPVGPPPPEASEDHPVEEEDHRQFILECLNECRATLPPNEAEVLSLYYGDPPLIFEEIGRKKKLTRSRIEQIHSSGLRKLRLAMADKLKTAGVSYR